MYISHVAQVSDTAQVTRQVSWFRTIDQEPSVELVNTFLVHTLYVVWDCV